MERKMFYLPFENFDMEKFIGKQSLEFNKYTREPIESNIINYYFDEWLPNDLLMKADKMSMAHGLEIRNPFLDIDLIKYFLSLKNKYKKKRFIFRQVIKKILPVEIINRKKQGFTLPLSYWINNKKFISRIMPHLLDLEKRNIFNKEMYQEIVNNPSKFRNDHRIWVLLNLELWCKIYIDGIDYKKIKI
jgi:asparagine synthase (glutamine-hydrolysing)